jgi:pre-rRNA-processing protein TSR1
MLARAQSKATAGTDACSVQPGTYVTVVLADVPAAAAAAILQRTAAATAAGSGCAPAAAVPLVVFGLLQHEAKLSVLNFGLKKVAGYQETLRNKEELLLVTGVRRCV